jgi:hypothetical protein
VTLADGLHCNVGQKIPTTVSQYPIVEACQNVNA